MSTGKSRSPLVHGSLLRNESVDRSNLSNQSLKESNGEHKKEKERTISKEQIMGMKRTSL